MITLQVKHSASSKPQENTAKVTSGSGPFLSRYQLILKEGRRNPSSLVLLGAVFQTAGLLCHFDSIVMKHSESQAIPFDEIRRINFLYILQHKAERPDSCIYCGCHMAIGERTRDHLIPRARISRVGNHYFRVYFGTLNIVQACRRCNALKGSDSLAAFGDRLRQQWLPNRFLILSNLKKLIA